MTARDRGERLTGDDRAVSIAITHALTIAITAVLVSGLLVGTGQLLDNQESRVAQEKFEEIGSDVVSHIEDVDRLNETGTEVTVTVRPEYPQRVVSTPYRINVTDDNDSHPFESEYAVLVESDLLEQPVRFPLNTTTAVDPDSVAQGGEVPICLESNEISIGVAC